MHTFWHEVASGVLPVLVTLSSGLVAWLFLQMMQIKSTLAEHRTRLDQKRQRLDKMDIELKEHSGSLRDELRHHGNQHHAAMQELKAEMTREIRELRAILVESLTGKRPRNNS